MKEPTTGPPQPKLLPVFGGNLATTITPGMIEEYRATRRMEKSLLGTTVKIATINRDHTLLKHLFNFVIRDGCLEKNPASNPILPYTCMPST